MKDKGMLFWKKRWFSICSAHHSYQKDCKLCNAGSYYNAWSVKWSQLIYKLFPETWRWWKSK